MTDESAEARKDKDKAKDKNKDNKNDVTVQISVNGEQAVGIVGKKNEELGSLVPQALEATGNVGRPAEDWELKDAAGVLMDLNAKLKDLTLTPTTVLFLALKAGVAGAL